MDGFDKYPLRPTKEETARVKYVYVEDANERLLARYKDTEDNVTDALRREWGGMFACYQRSESCVTLRWHK